MSYDSDELFRNTGLERADRLAKDLEWFASQGHEIPEAGPDGTTYATYLTELSETDVPAFICHFYNVYFAHSAGGKFIGKKVCAVHPVMLHLGSNSKYMCRDHVQLLLCFVD